MRIIPNSQLSTLTIQTFKSVKLETILKQFFAMLFRVLFETKTLIYFFRIWLLGERSYCCFQRANNFWHFLFLLMRTAIWYYFFMLSLQSTTFIYLNVMLMFFIVSSIIWSFFTNVFLTSFVKRFLFQTVFLFSSSRFFKGGALVWNV